MRGATLIELLLSLSLSLLLLGLLSIVYLTTQKEITAQNTLTVLHEHAFFVVQKLKFDIQRAGFIGCPLFTADFPLGNRTRYFLSPKNKIEVQQDARLSSVMTVRYRSVEVAFLRVDQRQSSLLELSSGLRVVPGELLLISDCRQADLFEVETVSSHGEGQTITTHQPLRYRYFKGAEIGRFEINTYSVERTGFYQTDVEGHKIRLIEGIEKMKTRIVGELNAIEGEVEVREKELRKTEVFFVGLRKPK
ncbi:MAG TPA: hypothetical protein VLH77_03000 [Gammaproteobacteria bacterium]|nr:hypothetical protein [Gammaproteobacteria bacterium]